MPFSNSLFRLSALFAVLIAAGCAEERDTASQSDSAATVNDRITRSEVIARANSWAQSPRAYSMNTIDPGTGYRQDCSGFASMAWHLSTPGLSTVTLPDVAYQIGWSQLRAGDVVMKGGAGTAGAAGHVIIFEKWADSSQTTFWAYEQTPPRTVYHAKSIPTGYLPYRYKNIIDDSSDDNDLYVVVRSGTGSGNTEIHALSRSSNFKDFTVHAATAMGATGTDGSWDFRVADFDGDGKKDLWSISKSNTGSSMTEVHILSGATNFSGFLVHAATALHLTGNDRSWVFLVGDYNRDGRADLWAVAKDKTGSGKTEIHILNGADGFKSFLLQAATALGTTGSGENAVFEVGDYNGDGALDLFAIMRSGTGSQRTEVHVLNGATGFQSFLLQTGTALAETGTDGTWNFALGDYNQDGKLDLYAIAKAGTASKTTEVHALNGADGFQSFVAHIASGLDETGIDDRCVFDF